jgi:high affinity choline transporter 7
VRQASEKEVILVMRLAVFGVGAMATAMALTITSIYDLWYLCSDLVYAILFPQLVSVLYIGKTNTYGSLCGFVSGTFFRLAGGEQKLGLAPLIKYPGWYEYDGFITQRFPFKTFSMLLSFAVVSSTTSKCTPKLFGIGTCKCLNCDVDYSVVVLRSMDFREWLR